MKNVCRSKENKDRVERYWINQFLVLVRKENQTQLLCVVCDSFSLSQISKFNSTTFGRIVRKEYENGKIWNICRQSIQILKMNNRWKAGKVFVVFSILTNTLTLRIFLLLKNGWMKYQSEREKSERNGKNQKS